MNIDGKGGISLDINKIKSINSKNNNGNHMQINKISMPNPQQNQCREGIEEYNAEDVISFYYLITKHILYFKGSIRL